MTENLGDQEALSFNLRVQKQLVAVTRAVEDLPRELTLQYPKTADFADIETLNLLPIADGRNSMIITLIQELIPSSESQIHAEEKRYPAYPEDRIIEIFNREDSKQNVRLIHFLLDTNIAHWWANIDDNEFQKFLQMAKQKHLPASLTSREEAKRLQDESLESFRATFNSMVVDRDLATPPFRVKEENLLKPQRKEPRKEPSRRKFLELYSGLKNLDVCIKNLNTIYPNEA